MATKKKRTAKCKNRKSSGKKKGSSVSSFLSSAKYLFIWTMMVVFAVICALVVYDYFFPRDRKLIPDVKQELPILETKPTEERKPSIVDGAKTPKDKALKPQATAILSFPKDAEIPRLQTQRKEQVIRYTGHTVSYNVDFKLSNWVAWELTGQEAKSQENERSNKFVPDPTLKGQTAMNEDYSRTGYDKGHMLPAGDVKWSAKAMRESFYYSNICPQIPGLNRGLWKGLEEQCRLWAKEFGALMIVTGPVIEDDLKRLGKNRVAIPHRFYKVIATISDNKYEGIAFIMENKDYGRILLKEIAIPIDSAEVITGIDFFYTLPDKPESEMEAKVNWSCWSF